MIEINHGEFADPWRGPLPMTEAPWIHETALVKNSRMGAWTMVGQRCEVFQSDLLDYAYLVKDVEVFNAEVGKFANVASHVRINPTNHGPDVWIGHGAILMPGVSVGTGAIIGSGSVVTKNVPDYAIVAGNPAKQIRRRVSEETEAAFKRIAWWDWSREELIRALPDFRALDAEAFAKKYDVK
jgi:acetyltransferase-like isoleucine patch superfamily enzyme